MSNELKGLEKKFNVDLSSFYNLYPVPIGDLCEKLGIDVIFDKTMENALHGRINYENNKYVIRVNDNHSVYNNIFTIAHELGHYFKHLNIVKEFGFADRKANIKIKEYTSQERKMEREANNFAASLLMPKEKFTQIFIDTNGNLRVLEEVFKVSLEAIEYRAINLGLILA